jgi:hypothetical protein
MRKFYSSCILLILFSAVSVSLKAQNFFTDEGANRTFQTNGNRVLVPDHFRAYSLDVQSMRDYLWTIPSEQHMGANRVNAPQILLPMPDGSVARFKIWESSVMAPELAAKFPEMRSFTGQGIDDPYATLKLDFNPYTGFHAQILSFAKGRVYIDPYARGDMRYYISFYAKDFTPIDRFVCGVIDEELDLRPENNIPEAACLGTTLRTYRLALACTGEYSIVVASPNPPSVAASMAAINVAMNRVNGVYQTEVALTMTLIPNNDLLIFLDPNTDPYTNNNGSTMLGQNQATIDAIIGSANYDIGHVFSTGGGGIATLNSPCNPATKARGVTGLPNPFGDPFYIDYVAHEMGHQWGANHSMAGCGSSPINTKYEVGSGTTIQGYAGICGAENIQPNSDPYFHAISFDEISNFIVVGVGAGGGPGCGVMSPTGNSLPAINPLPFNNVSIPPSTPFTLTGTATDPNGDALTYSWEQWDIGGGSVHTWNAGATAPPGNTVPLFKARIPKTTGERTIPDIAVILAGYPANPPATMGGLKGETLSPVARAMKFRLNVRDNRAGGSGTVSLGSGGCQDPTTYQINVVGSTPFTVTSPNGGESYPGGSTQTITWNNAGTNAAPYNVANVKITLSTDGGLTYPTVVVASTPNTGSASVTIPVVTPTSQARIKIEAIDNIFFDISNNNFSITVPVSGFTFNNPAPATSACPAGTSMNITLNVISNGGFSNPVTLSASGNPGGTTVSFSQNPVTPTASPGTPVTVTLNGTNTLNFGSYVINVLGTASGAPNQNVNLTYTINQGAGPAITAQPNNQTICAGGNTSFSITSATATGFQWQVSTDGGANYNNVSNGGVYSGATTATLNITGATAGMNNYRYRCMASSQCGSSTSATGILTVNTAPSISGHPQNITLCAGSNHTFTVSAGGSGITYQWQEDAGSGFANVTNGGVYSGANTANLTLTGIPAGMNGYKFRCVVSGTCPPNATSNEATLTVVVPVSVTQHPNNVTVCDGGNASFTAAGSGSGVIYQWQVNTGSGFGNVTNGGVYSGATTATLSITGATTAMNGYQYRCLMSNATCTSPATTNAATLTVNALPTISSHPSSATICTGSNQSFSVTASGTGITYQWQLNTGSGFTNLSDGGVYSGTGTATLNITGATTALTGYQYRCVVSGTCTPPATSNTATLTVIAPPTITGQPTNRELCSGSNTTFTVTGTSTQTIIYQWQVNSGSGFVNVTNTGVYSGANTATLTITGAPANMSGYQYRCLLSNATCTSPTISASATLTVRQLPTVGLTANPLTSLLPGQSTTLTATPSASTGGTLTITWLYNGTPVSNPGNTRVVNVEQIGNYQVQIQETWPSTLNCSNASTVVTIDAPPSQKLFIFPSPNNGQFTVSYYNSAGNSIGRTVVIYDSKGRQIFNKRFTVSGPYTLIPIDIRPAQGGVFHVVIGDNNGNKLITGKVMITAQ